MFARLALRKGAELWRPRILQASSYWSISSMGHLELRERSTETFKDIIARWDESNKIYFGPDRDFKNFPVMKQPEHYPPTRLGVFPDAWFQAFYNKTGVTGPYVLLGSTWLFLLSKEIVVVDHFFTEILTIGGGFVLATYLSRNAVREYSNKYFKDFNDKYWYEPLHENIEELQQAVDDTEDEIGRQEGRKYIFEAQRENVDLQLECAYRQRMNAVYEAVKKRLDYQVAKENAVTQFEQSHMVNWIIGNVMKSITPQQEKDMLTRCIQDLKSLSATAKV